MKATVETVKLIVIRGRIGSMSTLTITEFLEARIAEDEDAARAATNAPWDLRGGNEWLFPFGFSIGADDDIRGVDAAHIARHDPARVLAECAAKRAIIEAHPTQTYSGIKDQFVMECLTCERFPCDTLKALAAVYADHPDYQQEWAL